jgi:hypothetical protein
LILLDLFTAPFALLSTTRAGIGVGGVAISSLGGALEVSEHSAASIGV